MADAYVVLRKGAVRTLAATLTAPPEDTYQVSGSPTWTLYDDAGAVVSGPTPVAGFDVDPARTVSVWAQLDTSARAAGSYRVQWRVDFADARPGLTDTELAQTRLTIEDPAGARAPYVAGVQRLLWDLVPAEDTDRLSLPHYYDALRQAVREYGGAQPRLISVDVPLVAGQFEYPLATLEAGASPAATWVAGRSRITALAAPFDAAAIGPTPLSPAAYSWNDPRAVWILREYLPQGGETARVLWETAHTLTDAVDTLPVGGDGLAEHRECLCQWAAGWLLANTLANTAAQTNDPQIESAVVSWRDMQQRRRQQGQDMMAAAAACWTAAVGTPGAPGAGPPNPYAAVRPTAFTVGGSPGRGF